MSKTKEGFSTGRGFLTIVDNAEHANNATNAQNTDFTNSGFWEFDVESAYLTAFHTYEIIISYDSAWYYCFCPPIADLVLIGQIMYLPTTQVAGHTVKPHMERVGDVFKFNGYIDSIAFNDNSVKTYCRQIR